MGQFSVSPSPDVEARQALDFALLTNVPGDYAIVLADPNLGSPFRSEVESRGGNAFLPDGGRMDLSEAGIMALEWLRFRSSGDLRFLRRLLELPKFSRVLRFDSDLKADDALAVCDYLIGEAVLSDLAQAEAFAEVQVDVDKEKSDRRKQLPAFLHVVKSQSLYPLSVPELLASAWKQGGEGIETAREVVGLYQSIAESPLYCDGELDINTAFSRALKSEPMFESSNAGDVELSGWLEASWMQAQRLIVCGCVEGSVPSSVTGHPFLPDSKRHALGLANNSSRFARDAYLFQSLLLSRPVEDFRASFSRFDSEGSPSLPSSLFLRCGEDDLPKRVLDLLAKSQRRAVVPHVTMVGGGACLRKRAKQWVK